MFKSHRADYLMIVGLFYFGGFMAQYGKKRGVDYTGGKKMSTDEKRRQWNIDLASRTLENMFGQTQVDENTIIHNRKKRRVTYTAESLFDKAEEYFENIIQANEEGVTIVPDIEDFCTFAHISRPLFLKYRRSDDMELADVANNIATAIASCKKQNAYAGLINPISFAMDMNNNHDYVQSRTEATINNNISVQQVETNIADIANRIPVEDIPLLEGEVVENEGGTE